MKYTVKMRNTTNKAEVTLASGLTKKQAEEMKAKMNPDNLPGIEVGVVRELNSREKAISRLIKQSASEWIGGNENALMDYPEDSEDYKEAKATLNHDTLFEVIYKDIMSDSRNNNDSHIRFAGKKFIEEEIERYLTKYGYGKEN